MQAASATVRDPYYDRKEVSNSDLSWLNDLMTPRQQYGDKEKAYAFGNLLDAMITEPSKIDYFKLTCEGYQHTEEEFELAGKMKAKFNEDLTCATLTKMSTFQKVFAGPVNFTYQGFDFTLTMRCKFDLWMEALKHGGDIKSTTATTHNQFIAACDHFDYFRQRYIYMELAGSDKDILIGISKENLQVFKQPITRGDKYWKIGKERAEELAFKWDLLFN